MSTSERGAAKRPATDVAGQEQPRKLVAHGHEREKTPSYDKFMQWCRSNGADVSGVIVRKGPHGTGLFATKFIPKGTPYCSIPASMQVTCSKALDSPIGKAILGSAAVTKPVSARSILYCFLISEANNSGGHWYPWLSACPSTYTDPLWWGEEPGSGAPLAQKLLSGTQAGYDFDFHKQCLLDMIEGLNLAALNSADPQMFPLELFTYERFLWARSFFASRCYHIDALCQQLSPNGSGSPVKELTTTYDKLVSEGKVTGDCPAFCAPLMDMLNHSPTTTVRVGLLSSSDSQGQGRIGISGDKDVEEGQECYNNYGGRTNLQLLYGFGFCVKGNVHDEVPVKLGAAVPTVAKKKLLQHCSVVVDATRALKRSPPHIPPELLATLRVLVMDDSLVNKLLGEQSSVPDSAPAKRTKSVADILFKPIVPTPEHPDCELDALEALAGFLVQKLSALSSLARTLVDGAETPFGVDSRRIAQIYVGSQLEVVSAAIESIREKSEQFQAQFGELLDKYADDSEAQE